MRLLLREREGEFMWRNWLSIIAAVLVISSESAFAQSRVALVIGNSNYQAAVSLPNPANDAKAVADALTGAGFEAEDGTGQNSPYTTALLKVIPEPAVPIEQALKRVRLLVHESTDGRQTPWESSSLISDFAFYPTGGATSASGPLPQVAQRDVQERNARERDAQARTTPRSLAWREQIKNRPQPRRAYDIVVMEDS